MSVKRRLYISNFLMLVMPVLLLILTSICLMLIYTGITGIREKPPLNVGELFSKRMEKVEEIALKQKSATSEKRIQSDIDEFNRQNEGTGMNLTLYQGHQQVYPVSLYEGMMPDMDFSQSNVIIVTDELAVYRAKAGEYTLVLSDSNFTVNNHDTFDKRIYAGTLMLIILIIVAIVTNWALTKFVFRSIMHPIQIIVEGVHQLRDGNLKYRILYDKQDEFASVCTEFNEMAERLSYMVEERTENEINRRELIAGISHDLRTPLTSIKAYVEGLEKGVATTPQMKLKYFDTIKAKTASLEHIINQLFLFSKLDIGDFPLYLELVDISVEMKRTLTAFEAEYRPKGLNLFYGQQFPHAEILIDVVQFRNVIQNVLENSLKYKDKEHVDVTVTCIEDEQCVEIRLMDNGPGVSALELDKLFNVFYRSDASRKRPDLGSGLGLAISSKVIERLSGRIHAELAPTGGLSVIITIPKYKSAKGENNEKNLDH
ncbi:sensor histidine kinase [Paenibacillus xylanexedens]|uniref:sensor histidine kinase n=1 Tax=Paenibacillus xylanexedens TaxID=528191 RepID=UPI00119D0307|nr:ATP-binding protein [Paenibacillus xylanexedens]